MKFNIAIRLKKETNDIFVFSLSKYLVILLLLVTLGCSRKPEYSVAVQKSLDQALENKEELMKVIAHYEKDEDDEQKLEAALYLIENMPYHGAGYYRDHSFKKVFEKVGDRNVPEAVQKKAWENARPALERFDYGKLEFKKDNRVVSAQFLIDNIESAFKAWQEYPWCKQLSFEDFKTYILPYRMSDEPIEACRTRFQKKYAWLVDSMKNSTSMEQAFEWIYNDFYAEYKNVGETHYPINMTYTEFLSAKSGLCADACHALGMALRSMGVKCTFDYSVQWGNQRPSVHSWIAYPRNTASTYFIDKGKKLEIPQHVHSGKFTIDEPGSKFLVDSIAPQSYKKGTKIRRATFQENPNSLAGKGNFKGQIPLGWNDLCNVDITNHYINTTSFKLKISDQSMEDKVVFLAVFDINKLNVVDFAVVENGEAAFREVGIDNVYFPVVFKARQLQSIAHPFLLKKNAELSFFVPQMETRQTLVANRKYPLLAYTLNNANLLFAGQFQGANRQDFTDAEPLFNVEKTYLFPTEVVVKNHHKFRYLRFLPEASRKLSIAEMEFVGSKNSKDEKIIGKAISNAEEADDGVTKAFDQDFSTVFQKPKHAWIGLDLGVGKHKRVSKIKFCPRSDSNFIMPGYEYELFYWDKAWVPFQKKIATDYQLFFDGVPKGTLFWLHCINGGQEERPFTYEHGRQLWW